MKRHRHSRQFGGTAALLAGIFLLSQDPALAKCMDDWLAVDQVPNGDQVELRATNRQQFPITYAVRVRSDTFSGRRGKTVRGSLAGEESASVMVVPDTSGSGPPTLRVSCSWTIGDPNAVHDDDYLYLLPYADGTSYRVLQGFGSRFSHRGIEQYAVDFNMAVGTPVHAARGGIIAQVVEEHDRGCWEDGCGRYANFIVILHDDGTTGEYYHLSKNGALVKVGDRVSAGQQIGLSGNTGHTTMPHLHFAVYRATRGASPQSIPVSFLSADGVVYNPRRGHHYLAVNRQQAGD
jgi:murein DD-endopeptidase MepM/ murein hydrolase activator NlpD